MGDTRTLSNTAKSPDKGTTVTGGGEGLPKTTLSGGSDNSSRKPRNKGSSIEPRYGKRLMKYFPISEGELGELFGIGVLAAIAFSLTTGFFSFAIGILKDIALNQPLPKETINNWDYISYGCFIASAFFLIIGVLLALRGHTKLAQIKSDTEFKD